MVEQAQSVLETDLLDARLLARWLKILDDGLKCQACQFRGVSTSTTKGVTSPVAAGRRQRSIYLFLGSSVILSGNTTE